MNTIFVVTPIYWQKSKKSKVLVSMNAYRNWHYTVSSKFKLEFGKLVSEQIKGIPAITGSYTASVKLYYQRTNCDGSNVVPLVEKVVLDALVAAGLLVGDSVRHHLGTSWTVSKDVENPRCEITITERDNVK